MTAKERVIKKKDVNLKFLAATLPALFRGSTEVFGQLVRWLEIRDSSAVWERLSSRFFTDESNGVLYAEDVVFHVAVVAKDGKSLYQFYSFKKLLGNAIVSNRNVKRVLFYKMLLVKVFDLKEAVPLKLSACLNVGCSYEQEDDGPWCTLYTETILNLLNAWSDGVHLVHASDEQRYYVDNALLQLVKDAKLVYNFNETDFPAVFLFSV
ncbi:unnamed protein product [Enterobius vermicularis]|uniref:Crinkler (CRN) family protein n=1 Tax=Enterobius vermicularis TaxID=51028 RepID=A0A0N4VKI8_ENTVE|nr:unnamed protein product [Enterobius vermicularis]